MIAVSGMACHFALLRLAVLSPMPFRVRLIQCEWPPPSPALSEQAGVHLKRDR
jgi:hypothetical protein